MPLWLKAVGWPHLPAATGGVTSATAVTGGVAAIGDKGRLRLAWVPPWDRVTATGGRRTGRQDDGRSNSNDNRQPAPLSAASPRG